MAMTEPLLRLRGAGFCYGDRRVFEALDFDVWPGDVIAVLGTNGSGKSTMLRCLGGLLTLSTGMAELEGRDLATRPPAERARRIGILFQQHAPAMPFTVREVVQLGRTPHLGWLGSSDEQDARVVREAMEMAGIGSLADRPYTELSGGERQLVLLARALAQQPGVILLDEPTSHLDLRNQVRCLSMIRALAARDVAVVFSTHDPNHAFVLGGRALLMKAGTTPIEGAVAQTLTSARLSDTYGVPIAVRAGSDGAAWCSPW